MSDSAFYWRPTRVAIAVYLAGSLGATGSAAPLQTDQFVGAAGCKSSSCHGGAGEKRSQYFTWVQQDFHGRAYAVLVDARSARMAETLSLPAAQTSERCTVCHSPLQSVAPARLAKTVRVDEGVSCESCHGAAGPWLRGHTRKDWSYATRVTAGMHDLRNFYVRANACVACHQNLAPDLLKAGHPELIFELDGQSVAEPEHWKDDDPARGPRAWLVGQAVALREMSFALAQNETVESESLTRWQGLAWLLAKATATQSRLPLIAPPGESTSRDLLVSVQQQADALARRAAVDPWNDVFAATALRALASADADFVPAKNISAGLLFRRAQRLVLALDRLSRATPQQPLGAPKNSALAPLFEDLRLQADFQPAKFAADLVTFRTTIERSP
ncbi:MAG TPA: multiheme c-type cytochrome [Chthoniobacterales bacterium]|nr:multiheme c-type cytochrome [Chthoniobacterales bacterium]